MTLSTKLLSALVFLVLLAPAYSDLLSTEQPSTRLAVAHNVTTNVIKTMVADAYQRADISSSVKKSTKTGSASAAIDKQAIS